MVGADHNAGCSAALNQLVRAVLADVVECSDFTIPPTDAEKTLTRKLKREVVAGVLNLAGMSGELPRAG